MTCLCTTETRSAVAGEKRINYEEKFQNLCKSHRPQLLLILSIKHPLSLFPSLSLTHSLQICPSFDNTQVRRAVTSPPQNNVIDLPAVLAMTRIETTKHSGCWKEKTAFKYSAQLLPFPSTQQAVAKHPLLSGSPDHLCLYLSPP